MYIIRPITLTQSTLTSSNVPDVEDIGTSTTALLIEVASKTFATQAGLPFVAGDWVKAYSTATPANYMYGKVTSYTGTSLVVNMTVNGGSGTPADWKISYGWNVGASYLAGDEVQIGTGVHKIYEALVNVTGGTSPELDVLLAVPKWLEVGATNRWQAFDSKVGSQTSQATSITYKITPAEVFDSIAFLGLDAVSVQVVLTDPSEGVVYNQTKSLLTTVITGTTTVMDWYTYFFSSIVKITDFVFLDIPPYLNAVMDITITYTGGTAKVGGIVFGLKTYIGITAANPNPTFGTTDYSTKTQDQWGNWSVTKRSNSKKMTCTLVIDNTVIDEIERLLASYLSEPLVWIGDVNYGSMIVYGYCKDHNTNAGYKNSSLAIEIEGLI